MQVRTDPPSHVVEDEIGQKLAAPEDGWHKRPSMESRFTSRFRASIVACPRFIEDLVVEHSGRGVGQYAIRGARVDTFAQRRPEVPCRLHVFEVDRFGPQAWKRQCLVDLGLCTPEWLGSPFIAPFALRSGARMVR
jgi:O-methyltransferase involved in polyketide biosynthesis